MAAPSLSSSQQKHTIKSQKQNKPSTRNVLASPYSVAWPELPNRCHVDITRRLNTTFHSVNVKREKLPWIRGKEKEERKKEALQKRCDDENPQSKNLRGQLVIGVNAVTRALERDQLRTVLVDRGTDPRVLVNHLLTLAATRDCPILLLNGLATTLASHLQVSSLIAIGFKTLGEEDDHAFDDLVEYLDGKAVRPDSGWLKYTDSVSTKVAPVSSACDTSPKQGDREGAQNETTNYVKTSEMRASLPVIDFDSIYVRKSESDLVNGKVKPQDFGSVGFVAFDESSEDELVICPRENTEERSGKLHNKRKRKHGKLLYEPARVGKMIGNPDRPKQKKKKKKQ